MSLFKAESVSYGTPDGTTVHTYSHEETRSFSNHINSILQPLNDPDLEGTLPLNPETDDLFKKVAKGVLLIKLVNAIKPGTVNENLMTKSKNPLSFQVAQNHDLSIRGCVKLGVKVVNIGAGDLSAAKPHLILGLVWQALKIGLLAKINLDQHPELALLFEENEDINKFINVAPEVNLLRWFNFHLKRAGHSRKVNNFTSDIKDAENYLVLLQQISPGTVPKGCQNEPDPLKRAELVCKYSKDIGCGGLLTPQDILDGNDKLNLAFTAVLFNKHPGLDVMEETDSQKKALEEAEKLLKEKFAEEARIREIAWKEEDEARKKAWEEEERIRKEKWEAEENASRLKFIEEQEKLNEVMRKMQEEKEKLELMIKKQEEAQQKLNEEEERQKKERETDESRKKKEEEERKKWEEKIKEDSKKLEDEINEKRQEAERIKEEQKKMEEELLRKQQEEEMRKKEVERMRLEFENEKEEEALRRQELEKMRQALEQEKEENEKKQREEENEKKQKEEENEKKQREEENEKKQQEEDYSVEEVKIEIEGEPGPEHEIYLNSIEHGDQWYGLTYSESVIKIAPSSKEMDDCYGIAYLKDRDTQVNGIELPVSYEPDKGLVVHSEPIGVVLKNFQDWTQTNKFHPPVTILLRIEEEFELDAGTFVITLDENVRNCFDKKQLYTPRQLQHGSPSLVEGAQLHGWPTLRALVGKFIFVLTGQEKYKYAYAGRLGGEFCFVDREIENTPDTTKGDRVFFSFSLKIESLNLMEKINSGIKNNIVSIKNNKNLFGTRDPRVEASKDSDADKKPIQETPNSPSTPKSPIRRNSSVTTPKGGRRTEIDWAFISDEIQKHKGLLSIGRIAGNMRQWNLGLRQGINCLITSQPRVQWSFGHQPFTKTKTHCWEDETSISSITKAKVINASDAVNTDNGMWIIYPSLGVKKEIKAVIYSNNVWKEEFTIDNGARSIERVELAPYKDGLVMFSRNTSESIKKSGQSIYYSVYTDGAWKKPIKMEIKTHYPPCVVRTGDNELQMFYQKKSGPIERVIYNGTEWTENKVFLEDQLPKSGGKPQQFKLSVAAGSKVIYLILAEHKAGDLYLVEIDRASNKAKSFTAISAETNAYSTHKVGLSVYNDILYMSVKQASGSKIQKSYDLFVCDYNGKKWSHSATLSDVVGTGFSPHGPCLCIHDQKLFLIYSSKIPGNMSCFVYHLWP